VELWLGVPVELWLDVPVDEGLGVPVDEWLGVPVEDGLGVGVGCMRHTRTLSTRRMDGPWRTTSKGCRTRKTSQYAAMGGRMTSTWIQPVTA
jgi:hypothetical protein